MDLRYPVKEGRVLHLNNINYKIDKVIGYGGSCIAYSSQREPSKYERSIGMPPIPSIIKEFYPAELANSITREKNNLIVLSDKQETYDSLRKNFEQGAVKQALFFIEDSDHSFAPSRIAAANNTVYSVVEAVNGHLLSEIREELNAHEISQVLLSLCYAVKGLHQNDKLHLDIKPSNIFLFNKGSFETCRIALFDFDTVTPVNEIETAFIPFSEDWCPSEQIVPHRKQISFATDIYAIGAVAYWLLSGEKVNKELLDSIIRERFDFLNEFEVLRGMKNAKEDISKLLYCTLKRNPTKRAQKIDDFNE